MYGYAGGVYVGRNSAAEISNSILWENTAYIGNEIYIDSAGVLAVSFSDIQSGWDGDGNIDMDPLFRDPANGDFHLMSIDCGEPYDSPCIDSGSPAIIDSLLDCSWGLGTALCDMGAYGGGDSATVDIDDPVPVPDNMTLLRNYPNPFNSSTTISFVLNEQSEVAVEIFNVLGERVEVLYEGALPAGPHLLIWRADDYTSGVYLARLKSNFGQKSVKMILLK